MWRGAAARDVQAVVVREPGAAPVVPRTTNLGNDAVRTRDTAPTCPPASRVTSTKPS